MRCHVCGYEKETNCDEDCVCYNPKCSEYYLKDK